MKTRSSRLAMLLRVAGYEPTPVIFRWRKSNDVSEFLKKFDAVQRRTARPTLQLS